MEPQIGRAKSNLEWIKTQKYYRSQLSPEMSHQADEIIQELSETTVQRVRRETKELFQVGGE